MRKPEVYIKLLLFIICAALFMCNLGSALPIIEMEKFYFQSVKEMFARGDWITPYYHGQLRFAKPILFYWCVSVSYLVFGVNNFAVRFPSAVFAVFTVLTTFKIGRILFDSKTGFLAAGITATFALFFMYARYASPDMALTFLTTYAMYLFIRAAGEPEKNGRLLDPPSRNPSPARVGSFKAFFAVLGLAVATKGLGGFIIPLVAVAAYIAGAKKWRIFQAMNIPLGIVIMAAVGLPWYLLMYKLHGDTYLNSIIVKETVGRVLYSPDNAAGIGFLKPYLAHFFDYVPALLVFFIPHSLFLPAALLHAFRSRDKSPREKNAYKFILSYFFAVFGIFTLMSSKIYHYMLPISPAFGLLAAGYLVNLEEKNLQFKSANFKIMYTATTIIYAASIPLILYAMRHLYPEKISPLSYAALLLPFLLIAPYWKKKPAPALFALPLTACLFMMFLAGQVMPILNDNIFPEFAEKIRQGMKKGDRVGVGSVDISQQQLGIYLDMPIDEVNVRWKNVEAASAAHRQKLIQYVASGGAFYLVISKDDYDKLIPDGLKTGLKIMDEKDTWRTRLKRAFRGNVVQDVLSGKKDLLKDVLRHRVYLVAG